MGVCNDCSGALSYHDQAFYNAIFYRYCIVKRLRNLNGAKGPTNTQVRRSKAWAEELAAQQGKLGKALGLRWKVSEWKSEAFS